MCMIDAEGVRLRVALSPGRNPSVAVAMNGHAFTRSVQPLRTTSSIQLLLAGLYIERPWSDEVTKALPFGLAGAAEAYPTAYLLGRISSSSVSCWIRRIQ
jgi:hypothetical protein